MLKKLTKMVLAISTLMLGASAATAAPKVDHAKLSLTSTGTITAVAEDGENFSKLSSQNLKFEGNVDVKMKRGRLTSYSVYMGVCGPGQCGTPAFKTLLWRDVGKTKKLKHDVSFDVSADQIPQGLSPNVQAAHIFNVCNENARGKSVDYVYLHNVQVTLGLKLKERGFDSSGTTAIDYTKHFTVPVTVICEAVPRHKISSDFTTPTVPFKVKSGKVFLTTYANQQPGGGSLPGDKCETLKVSVRWETNMAGKVKFRLHRPGYGAIVKTVNAKQEAGGNFYARYQKFMTVNKTTVVRAMAETPTKFPGPYGYVSTGWREITIYCGGELTSPQPQNDDPMPPNVYAASLQIADPGGTKCPRPGQISFKLTKDFSGPAQYELACTNGIKRSGSIPSSKTGAHEWTSTGTVIFQVQKTVQVNCALKHLRHDKLKKVVLRGKYFQCIKRTDGTAGPGDLVSEPQPTQDPSSTGVVVPPSTGPNKIVDPVRRISCLNGAVRNNNCYCPRNHQKIKKGPRQWYCKAQTSVVPPSTGPNRIVDPVRKVSCLNGVVRNRSCFCQRTHKKVRRGPNAWGCVKIMVVVPPKKSGSSATTGGKRKIVLPPRRVAPKRRKATKKRRTPSSTSSSPTTILRLR